MVSSSTQTMSPAPTMQDIATAAGRGKATVSLALRNDPRIREATRLRIQKIAREMGYRTNAMVSNLMTQLRTSQTPRCHAAIGFLTASPENVALKKVHPLHQWRTGIKSRAREVGYEVNEFRLNEPGADAARLMKKFKSKNVHGLIVAAIAGSRSLPGEFAELWERYACILVGAPAVEPPVHFVSNDQYFTSLQAVEKVLGMGYRRPGLVIDPALDVLLEQRFISGFYSARHLMPKGVVLSHLDFSPDERGKFKAWFRQIRPDVIITLHHEVGIWLSELKVAVPGGVGLVHLDIPPGAGNVSGMNQNNEQVGWAAVDMLVSQLHRNEFGAPAFTQCLLVQSHWVDGGTVVRQRGTL
jgi:DNA-binding LacI/PurR family transcriptional regulator